ncbi:hypothetical protein [Cohnella pontilimi]|uniref:hypothetical protein n=1 Tax=Cohnella pontilimi TaxID=2564100 RepID=UPI00145E7195|nr:hypothetical protein [Cohnella pontilimi]
MNEPVYLVVWLLGLFGLLGCVLAGVARLVKRDTTEHDRRYVWKTVKWPPDDDASDQP